MAPFGREPPEKVRKELSSSSAGRKQSVVGRAFGAEPDENAAVPPHLSAEAGERETHKRDVQPRSTEKAFAAEPGESDGSDLDESSCDDISESANQSVPANSSVFELGWEALHKYDSATTWTKMQNQPVRKSKRAYDNRKREQMATSSRRSDVFRKNGMDKGRLQQILSSPTCQCSSFPITCVSLAIHGFVSNVFQRLSSAPGASQVHAKFASRSSSNINCWVSLKSSGR